MKTFIEIPEDEDAVRIQTTLYPSEIEYIKEEKGWNYNDLIREAIILKRDTMDKIENMRVRMQKIEKKVFKDTKQ